MAVNPYSSSPATGDSALDNRIRNTTRLEDNYRELYDAYSLAQSYDLEQDTFTPAFEKREQVTGPQRNKMLSPQDELASYEDLANSFDNNPDQKVRSGGAQTRLEKWASSAALTVLGTESLIKGGIEKQVVNSLKGLTGLTADAAETATDKASDLGIADSNKRGIETALRNAEKFLAEFKGDPAEAALAEGFREANPNVAKVLDVGTQVATNIVGFATAPVVTAEALFGQMFNEAAEAFDAEKGSDSDAGDRLRFASIYATAGLASETVLGIEKATARLITELPPATKGKLLGWLAGKSTIEGATETGQGWLLEFMLTQEFGREGEYLNEEAVENFLFGAIGGGLGSAAAIGASRVAQTSKAEADSKESWEHLNLMYEGDEKLFLEENATGDNRLDELMTKAFKDASDQNLETLSKYVEHNSVPQGVEQLELSFEEQADFAGISEVAVPIFEEIVEANQVVALPETSVDTRTGVKAVDTPSDVNVLPDGTEPIIAKKSELLESQRRKKEDKADRLLRINEGLRAKFKIAFADIRAAHKSQVRNLIKQAKQQKIDDRKGYAAQHATIVQHVRNVNKLMKSLPTEIRGRWSPFPEAANKKTIKGQEAHLARLETKVNETLEKFTKKQIRTKQKGIVRQLTKGRKDPARKRTGEGRFLASQVAKMAIKAPKGKIQEQLDQAIAKVESDIKKNFPKDQDRLEEAVSETETIFALLADPQTIKDHKDGLTLLHEMREDSLGERKAFKKARRDKQKKYLSSFFANLRPDKVIHDKAQLGEVVSDRNGVLDWANNKRIAVRSWMFDAADGLEHLIENLHTVRGTPFEGSLHDLTTKLIANARNNYNQNFIDHQTFLREAVDQIAEDKGLTPRQSLKMLKDWQSKTVEYGPDNAIAYVTSKTQKEPQPIRLTKMQMVTLWMWRQDGTLDSNFKSMKWDEKMDANLKEHLGPEGIALGKAFLKRYADMGRRMNDALFENDGYKLNLITNYSPKRTIQDSRNIESRDAVGTSDQYAIAFEKTQAMKERTDRRSPLDPQDAGSLFAEEMAANEHYIAFGGVVRDMRELFQNDSVRSTLKAKGHANTLKFIDEQLVTLANQGMARQRGVKLLNTLLSNISVSKIGANLPSAFKQLGSIPAAVDTIGIKAYTKGTKDFITSPREKWKILRETPFIQERLRTNFDPIMRDGQTLRSFDKIISESKVWSGDYKNKIMFMTRYADITAVIAGGWPVYKHHYDQQISEGKSHKEASKVAEVEFGRAMARNQQDAFSTSKGYYQQQSTLRLFTMFLSSPIQYQREVNRALRSMLFGSKRISKAQAIKTFTIYHIVLPQIFTAMGNLGIGFWGGDEETTEEMINRHKEALLLGNFQTLFLVGMVNTKIVDAIFGDFKDFRSSIPILSSIDKTGTLIGGLVDAALDEDKEVSEDEMMGALWEAAVNVTEAGTGVPVANVVRWGTQIGEFVEDPTVVNTVQAFNVTDYAIGQPKDDKKKKKRIGK